jgi:plastocyanin
MFLGIASAISFTSAFAETQVTIPLGASLQANPFSLSPAVVNAKINDTVTWQNQDSVIHTVTTGTTQYGFDGRFDSAPIQPRKTFSHTFDKSGVYQYFCLFHPWMTGVVNVSDGSSVEPVIAITFSTDKSSYKSGDKLWQPGGSYAVFAQYGYRSYVTESKINAESGAQGKTGQDSATQTQQTNTSLYAATSYPSTHKIIAANENDYVSVQTEKHIYFPGEEIKIIGSIWSGTFQQVGGPAYLATVSTGGPDSNSVSEVVGIQVRDTAGNLILNQPLL